MRKLFLWHSLLFTPMIAVTLMAIIFGHARGQTNAFATSEYCALPCWNGITPGITTIREASSLLVTAGYRVKNVAEEPGIPGQLTFETSNPVAICQIGLGRGRALDPLVREITLQVCDRTTLGDIVGVIGPPQTLLPIASILIYHEGQTLVILRMPICETRLAPHNEIRYIALSEIGVNAPMTDQPGDLPWRGFSPVWRYAQHFPRQPVC